MSPQALLNNDPLSPTRLLALDYKEGCPEPVQIGSPSSPEKSERFEPVGIAFERKLSGLHLEDGTEPAAPVESPPADKAEPSAVDEASPRTEETTEKKKKKKKKNADGEEIEEEEMVECYKILNLEHLEVKATLDDIKKSYRKLSLQLHPDKAQQNGIDVEQAAEQFKTIQKAYDILTDPAKRVLFDSVMPAKYDRIPEEAAEGDFFEAYGAAFERFSRWSEVKPVPTLGDMNTAMEEVDNFYDFWFEFKSWRVIKGEEEHELDDAEDSYERRWMNVENERERKRLKKEHMKTIATLREQAFKLDPRVQAAKAAEAAERERIKQEKLEAKLAKEEAKRAEQNKGKSAKELAKESEMQERAMLEKKKADEKNLAQAEAAKEEADQAAKVQAAILARQKKAKEAKKASAKKGSKKK